MGEPSGVEHHTRDAFSGRAVQPVDQLTLMVALAAYRLATELQGHSLAELLQIGQSGRAVHFRLAAPQEVEVRTVENEDHLGTSLGASCAPLPAAAGVTPPP